MESRKVLKELYIGIGIHVVVFMIIGSIFMRPVWIYIPALIVGGLGACFQAYGIYDTLDRALELSSKGAKSFATTRSIFRLIMCMAIMIGGILIHWTAFVGVTVGLLGLKISAFMNPFVKKLIIKFNGNKEIDRVDSTLDIESK